MDEIRADAIRQTIVALQGYFRDRIDYKVEVGTSWRAPGAAPDLTTPDILIRSQSLGASDGFADVPAFVLNFTTPRSGETRHWASVERYEESGVDEWFSFACGLSARGLVLQGGRWDGEGYLPLFATGDHLSSRLGFDMIVESGVMKIVDWAARFPSLELRELVAKVEGRLRAAERSVERIEARRSEAGERVRSLQSRLAKLLLEAEQPQALLAKAGVAPNGNGA